MIILIDNYKRGAEKSMFTLLLANYLAMLRRRKVTVADLDYQRPLITATGADAPAQPPPYDIVRAGTSLAGYNLTQDQKKIVIINMPADTDRHNLIAMIAAADLILSPFTYDRVKIDASILFALAARKINSQAPMVFIPISTGRVRQHETQFETDKVLRRLGIITPAIAGHDEFEQVSIFHTPLTLYPVVLPVMELLYERYILGEQDE